MKKLTVVLAVLALPALIILPLSVKGQQEALAGESITIVGASMLPPEHIYHRGMEKFEELLAKYYKGPVAVKVELHHSGDLGQEQDFFAHMVQGVAVDMAFVAPSWMATWSKKAAFMDTPFLFSSLEHWDKSLRAGVLEPIEKELQRIGVRVLGHGGGGKRNLVLRKPVKTMDDLPSVLLRVMGSPIQARVFNAIGFKATMLAYGEVYNAVKTGVIDGLENEAVGMASMKMYEVAPHVIETRHTITIRPLCFSEKRLQSFPKDLQEAVLKAGAEAAKWARDTESMEDSQVLERLAKEGKLTLYPFDTTKMIERAAPVVDAYAKELGVEDVLNRIKALR